MELNGSILILLPDRVIHIRGMILLTKNRFVSYLQVIHHLTLFCLQTVYSGLEPK